MKTNKVLIIKTNKDPLSDFEFVDSIKRILEDVHVGFEVSSYKNLTSVVDKYDKIIIAGTNLQDFDYLNKTALDNFENLLSLNKSILGICSGMHIISSVFEVPLVDVREIKVKHIRIGKLWRKVFLMHNKSLNYSSALKKFDILSRTKVNNVYVPQIVVDKSHRFFGFQFHPEVFNEDLIVDFVRGELCRSLALAETNRRQN